jgi:hypothetical protein
VDVTPAFRVISGIAHSKVWSLYGSSQRAEVINQGEGRQAVSVSADDELAFVGTMLAMRLAVAAATDLESYAATAAP